jgi:hypothetical protein
MLFLIGWDDSQYDPMGKFVCGDEVSTIGPHKVDVPKSNSTTILTHIFYWYVVRCGYKSMTPKIYHVFERV